MATQWPHNIHSLSGVDAKSLIIKEPLVGIEPTTYSLRVNCSTPELQRP